VPRCSLSRSEAEDDPDAFYAPWTATRRFRRAEHEMIEEPCAENNQHFDWHIPVADKPDF
jgi:hypothetical protein